VHLVLQLLLDRTHANSELVSGIDSLKRAQGQSSEASDCER
jgi:hypothetical protein